ALDGKRHQLANHPSAIERYHGQLLQLAQQALQQLEELGLAGEHDLAAASGDTALEQALRKRLPVLPVRKHAEQLLREHGTMTQALEAAQTLLRERQAEVDAIETRLRTQSVVEVRTALRGALERAKALGDSAAAMQKAELSVQKAQAALAQSLSGLREWARPAAQLAGVALPSAQLVSARLAQRRDLLSSLKSATQRRDELAAAVEKSALGLRQYREQHHPATQEDLARARERRDNAWQSIKQGLAPLAEAAEPFEASLRNADAL